MKINKISTKVTGHKMEARKLKSKDLLKLKKILEFWIKDRNTKQPLPHEVNETILEMEKSIKGISQRYYLVIENKRNQVFGVIGIKEPDKRMISYCVTKKPAELVNFFIANKERGKGLGKFLIEKIESFASELGYTEIILNSGPRYKATAWGFYDKLSGYKRIGIAKKYYGDGGDAPVWQKLL